MGVTQWVLLGFILVLIIAYPIMAIYRNKKENEKVKTQSDGIKKGDKVLTTSGVYGTVIDIQINGNGKIITLETGNAKNKGYVSVDAYAIYTVFPDEKALAKEQKELEEKAKAEGKVEDAKVEDAKIEDAKVEDVKVEAKMAEVKKSETANKPKAKTTKKTK